MKEWGFREMSSAPMQRAIWQQVSKTIGHLHMLNCNSTAGTYPMEITTVVNEDITRESYFKQYLQGQNYQ